MRNLCAPSNRGTNCRIEHKVLGHDHDRVLVLSTQHSAVLDVAEDLWSEYLARPANSTLAKELEHIGLDDIPDTSVDVLQSLDFTNLILNLTSACNLACAYCFRDQRPRTMSFETAKHAVDLIPKYFNATRANISFFGGEPLLVSDRLVDIVAYARQNITDRKLSFSLTTNGVLLSDEMADFLAANNFSVTVSLDGDETTNLRTRPARNGQSTAAYRKTVRSISALLHRGLDVRCNVVVTPLNASSLYDFVVELRSKGVQRITLSAVSSSQFSLDRNDYRAIKEQEREIIDLLMKDHDLIVEPISSVITLIRTHKLHLFRCGFGRLRLMVQPDGTISPCQRVTAPMGHVSTGIDMKRARALALDSVDHRPWCRKCRVRYLCGGNCYQESLELQGRMNRPHYPYCRQFSEMVALVARRLSQCNVARAHSALRVL